MLQDDDKDIFVRMLKGGVIEHNDSQLPKLWEAVAKTIELSVGLNTSATTSAVTIFAVDAG